MKKIISFFIVFSLILVICFVFNLLKNINSNNYYDNSDNNINSEIEVVDSIDDLNGSKNTNDFNIKVNEEKNENLEIEAVDKGSDLEKLIQLQKDIEKIENEKNKLNDELFILNNEISTYKNEMRNNEKKKYKKESTLKSYLKWLSFNGNINNLYYAILNSNNISEAINNYNMANEFVERISNNILKIESDNKELDSNRNEIANKKALYRLLIGDNNVQEQKLKEKNNELVELMKNNNEILSLEAYNSISNINNDINNSQYHWRGNPNGFMILPVSNYTITSEWGNRVHPISGIVKHHAGVDLAVDMNSIVRASADGIVIKASWYGGYGKVVMINHGNGIITLYGHNNKLLVSEGDTVSQGQPIALAGSTGYSTGPHCHFEVRYNNTDINPFTYIKN